MFCSHCGKSAENKFCSNCGHELSAVPVDESHANNFYRIDRGNVGLPATWENEVRHAVLMQTPQIRAEIERQSQLAQKSMTGEQFLEICDKIMPLVSGTAIPMAKLAPVLQSTYAKWGFWTGKERSQSFNVPAGRMIVRLMCSLAHKGQTLRHVVQANDGCSFEALLPSNLYALAGDLLISVQARAERTEVKAATKIKGQLFDWGKSRRCLDQLFIDLGKKTACETC